MRPVLLACCGALAACLAAAAPIPKPKEARYFNQPGWDSPIDPHKDCRFSRAGTAVTIEVPAKPHVLDLYTPRANAPRLLREVTGDFRAEVQVRADWRPTPLSTLAGHASRVTAGLILVSELGEKAVLCFEYGVRQGTQVPWGMGEFTTAAENHPVAPWGSVSIGLAWKLPAPKTALLRFERRGDKCQGMSSPDGEVWRRIEAPTCLHVNLPRKVKVGVMVCSTSKRAFKVTFDRFKLTPLKPE